MGSSDSKDYPLLGATVMNEIASDHCHCTIRKSYG